MGYAAIALAMLGLAVGLTSRVWALLPILVLLFFVTVGYSVQQHFGIFDAVLVTVLAQIIIQSCYFIGLVVRANLIPPSKRVIKLAAKAPIQVFAAQTGHRLGQHVA
jgi:hypothetical protein